MVNVFVILIDGVIIVNFCVGVWVNVFVCLFELLLVCVLLDGVMLIKGWD